MSSAKKSVTEYEKATVTIYFPKGEACCDTCPLLETYSRRQCRRTGEYLVQGYLFGGMCPLVFTDEEEK